LDAKKEEVKVRAEAVLITSNARQQEITKLSSLKEQRNAAVNAMHAAVEAEIAEAGLEEAEEDVGAVAEVAVRLEEARNLSDAVRRSQARIDELTTLERDESQRLMVVKEQEEEIVNDIKDAITRLHASTGRLLNSIKSRHRQLVTTQMSIERQVIESDYEPLLVRRLENISLLVNKTDEIRTILESIVELQNTGSSSDLEEDELRQDLQIALRELRESGTDAVQLILD
jgi:hypothetical protein